MMRIFLLPLVLILPSQEGEGKEGKGKDQGWGEEKRGREEGVWGV